MATFFGQITGPLNAPSLQGGQVPLFLAVQLALAAGLGYLAWQNLRQSGIGVFRKFGYGALALAGLTLARFLELKLGVMDLNFVAAIHSVADLVLVASLLFGARSLVRRGSMTRSNVFILAMAGFCSLFWGLMGGDDGHSLLAANVPAAGFLLGFYGLSCYFLMSALLARFADEKEKLHTELLVHLERGQGLAEEMAEVSEAAEVTQRLLAAQKEDTGQLLQRSRTLEQILAISARMHAARGLNELFDQVVHAVREILGFNMVLLRINSHSTQAFEARAFAGIPEDGKVLLAGLQVTAEDFGRMTQSRFRISDSYFISHKDDSSEAVTEGGYTPDLGLRGEDEWHEEDALIVPLISTSGETLGYLSVDDPQDKCLPSLGTIRQLEFLARQATAAYESAELCDRLAQNNTELTLASEKTKNLSDMKNNFVANVSHELRTPLTSIRAYTEILQQGTMEMSEEVRLEFLEIIQNESEKLSQIIDDILDLSHMENRGDRLDRDEADLASLLRRVTDKAAEKADEETIAFEVDVPESAVHLDVDPMLWQQLLEHLTGNAIKFTPSGGSVQVRLFDEDRLVRLEVSDTGIGIPEEKMPFIFDRFYQVDGSSTREHGGQGVGLALCQDIVRFHDGRIWAENRPGGGTLFTALLPRRERVVLRASGKKQSMSGENPENFLERLVHWIAETLNVKMVSLLVPDVSEQQMTVLAAIGLPESVVHGTRIRRGAGIVGKVWSSGRTLHVEDIAGDGRFGKTRNSPQYSTPSFLSVPLLDGMEVIGVVNVNNRFDGRALSGDDRLLLEAMAPRLAYLLKEYFDFQDRGGDFSGLQNVLRVSAAAGLGERDALRNACLEVAMATGRAVKLPEQELEHLAFALKYYDVGLSQVPDRILRKTGSLTREERERIERHVHASLDILAPLQMVTKVRQIILHHHEQFNGQGYPEGIDGEAIPLGSRIIALADTLNAMLRHRPWRPAFGCREAFAEIESLSGSQFCPRITPVFLEEAAKRLAEIDRLQSVSMSIEAQDSASRADNTAGVH